MFIANALFKVVSSYSVTVNSSDISGNLPSTVTYNSGDLFVGDPNEYSISKLMTANVIKLQNYIDAYDPLSTTNIPYTPNDPNAWFTISPPNTMQEAIDELILGNRDKSLTNNTPLPILKATVNSGEHFAAKCLFIVEVSDGTDIQVRTGDVNLGAINKLGAFSYLNGVNTGSLLSTGTLTITFSWANVGSDATLSVTAASSLTSPTIKFHYVLASVSDPEVFMYL